CAHPVSVQSESGTKIARTSTVAPALHSLRAVKDEVQGSARTCPQLGGPFYVHLLRTGVSCSVCARGLRDGQRANQYSEQREVLESLAVDPYLADPKLRRGNRGGELDRLDSSDRLCGGKRSKARD